MHKKHLHLKREILRQLSRAELTKAAGAVPALTDGNNGCHSEATGCPTVTDWSCLWGSCHVSIDEA